AGWPLRRWRSGELYGNAGTAPDGGEGARVAGHPGDDGHRAGRPDLVAAAHRRGAEENTKGLTRGPVAEIAEGHDLLGQLGLQRQTGAEVDLVAPGLGPRAERKPGGDGGGSARVVQLAGGADATGGDANRAFHIHGGPEVAPKPPDSRCAPAWPGRASLTERLLDRLVERGQPGLDVLAEVHAQHAPAAVGQDVDVAARLRRLDDA